MRSHFAASDATPQDSPWLQEIDGFVDRATVIRRLLYRFRAEDVVTRRYLRSYIDEEWQGLRSSYESLREKFACLDSD